MSMKKIFLIFPFPDYVRKFLISAPLDSSIRRPRELCTQLIIQNQCKIVSKVILTSLHNQEPPVINDFIQKILSSLNILRKQDKLGKNFKICNFILPS